MPAWPTLTDDEVWDVTAFVLHCRRTPMSGSPHIELRGTVQGVGFRPWVYRLAVATASRPGPQRRGGVTIDIFGSARRSIALPLAFCAIRPLPPTFATRDAHRSPSSR